MMNNWEIPTVAVAVDVVVLTIRAHQLQVLLVERAISPHLGKLALPGGFLATEQEDLDTAAARELTEETGLSTTSIHLEQLHTYGAPNRDPRGRVISIAYLAILPDLPEPVAGGDARGAQWVEARQAQRRRANLAFDHDRILADAIERARARLEYTTLATAFCPPHFTVADLRKVYEIMWDRSLDARNFHRKITGIDDFLIPIGQHTTKHGGRPAALYRTGKADKLHPAILRDA
jgi:8-oxo-dGTP diphosphatase